ncbi:fatty acid desaturase [Acidithiobacillus ferridurans]|uniref:fatty acid desaturase n=1 Tax=Acidithiobacillus ferridurans TaxID=1232575 RepID=UPI001C07C08B|nr:fatty acid desaturase [Acidithiobacillus ferridurans]MBU2734133.1 fatty acid desaturase [Acidithiobacillus ferridurans]
MATKIFRYEDGLMPNTILFGSLFLSYFVGIMLIIRQAYLFNIIGLVLVMLSLVLSAYVIHEAAHGTIFYSRVANHRCGVIMGWLNGSCFASFADLRRKHMQHHRDRADVVAFDYKDLLSRGPSWLCNVVLFLEWAYIPAVEFIMRGYVMILPFVDSTRVADRKRIIYVLILRLLFFAGLAWISLRALVLYFVAYLIFITVLRFADCFQHTYDTFYILGEKSIPRDQIRDRIYEQDNTFSNLVSVRYPVLNMLLLNFSYHNAHHEKPGVPWYRLPSLHYELYGNDSGNIIPMSRLISVFHKYRVKRILSDGAGKVTSGLYKADGFYGAIGVSFLTAV